MELAIDQSPPTGRRAPHRYVKPGLWRAYWKAPGDQTRNRLVEAYQLLVRDIVARLAQRLPRSVDRGDLATAANVGLIAAVKGFDPSRRVRFELYAELRIRGAVLDELRTQDWLPRPWRTRLDLQKRTLESMRSELGREPTDPEVAAEMGVPFEEYEQHFGTILPGAPAGSQQRSPNGEEMTSRLERVVDTRSDQPGELLTRSELLRLLAQRMTEQESRIVYLKYWEDLSMREIGELTRLSESRVSKIHTRLLERLKGTFQAQVSESAG
jgi:RNA polymerase sigma factor for flagellar operon FliA